MWSSFVSTARFVTVAAIALNIYAYVPLGNSNLQAIFRSSLIQGFASSGQKPKTQKVT
jgi:hypothetical protein